MESTHPLLVGDGVELVAERPRPYHVGELALQSVEKSGVVLCPKRHHGDLGHVRQGWEKIENY